MKSIEDLIKQKQRAVLKMNSIGTELDRLIIEKYGFHYSETNDDPIIDALDYGTNGITPEDFHERMSLYQEDFDNDERFRTIA